LPSLVLREHLDVVHDYVQIVRASKNNLLQIKHHEYAHHPVTIKNISQARLSPKHGD